MTAYYIILCTVLKTLPHKRLLGGISADRVSVFTGIWWAINLKRNIIVILSISPSFICLIIRDLHCTLALFIYFTLNIKFRYGVSPVNQAQTYVQDQDQIIQKNIVCSSVIFHSTPFYLTWIAGCKLALWFCKCVKGVYLGRTLCFHNWLQTGPSIASHVWGGNPEAKAAMVCQRVQEEHQSAARLLWNLSGTTDLYSGKCSKQYQR